MYSNPKLLSDHIDDIAGYDAHRQDIHERSGNKVCQQGVTVDFPYVVEGERDIPVLVESTVYHCRESDERGDYEEIEPVVTEIRLASTNTKVDEDDLRILAGGLTSEYIDLEIHKAAEYFYKHPEEIDDPAGYKIGGGNELFMGRESPQ